MVVESGPGSWPRRLAGLMGFGTYIWNRPISQLHIAVKDPVGLGLLRQKDEHCGQRQIPEHTETAQCTQQAGPGLSIPNLPSKKDEQWSHRRVFEHAERLAASKPCGSVGFTPSGQITPSKKDKHCRIQARPDQLVVRPALGQDHYRINQVRQSNHQWLSPWEATLPPGAEQELLDFHHYCREMDRRQRAGEALAMVVELDSNVVGTVTLSGVQRGSMSQGMVGYWVSEDVAHRGVGSVSVAIVIDLVIKELGLHRVEVNVRPENECSLGLCRKLGLREEGLRTRFMNIAGHWADHVAFATDAEALPERGLVHQIWGVDVF